MSSLKPLKYKGYKGGGCVPYLIANMTDSDIPIKGLKITETTSFDEYDASKMFQRAMDSKNYFKAIIAEDRYMDFHSRTIKVQKWIEHHRFEKSAMIQQVKMIANEDQLLVILLEVAMPNKGLHAVGLFYSPKSGKTIIIDPSKDKPISSGIALAFQMYKVLKVCPLFWKADGFVLYPVEGTRFLFEEPQSIEA